MTYIVHMETKSEGYPLFQDFKFSDKQFVQAEGVKEWGRRGWSLQLSHLKMQWCARDFAGCSDPTRHITHSLTQCNVSTRNFDSSTLIFKCHHIVLDVWCVWWVFWRCTCVTPRQTESTSHAFNTFWTLLRHRNYYVWLCTSFKKLKLNTSVHLCRHLLHRLKKRPKVVMNQCNISQLTCIGFSINDTRYIEYKCAIRCVAEIRNKVCIHVDIQAPPPRVYLGILDNHGSISPPVTTCFL